MSSNKHKTKIFKASFLNNADQFSSEMKIGAIYPVMSEEVFVPLLGQMWSKAKEKYRKRNERDAIAFAEWCANKWYRTSEHWLDKSKKGIPQDMKTTEELYQLWKSKKS